MRTRLLTLMFCAALPLAAGFAFAPSARAQTAPGVADYTRVSQLEQQVQELTNQLEQRDFQLRQLQASFDKFAADTNTRLQDLEARLTGAAPVASAGSPAVVPPQPDAPAPAASQGGDGSLDDPNAAFKPGSSVSPLGQITEGGATGNGDSLTSGTPQKTESAAQSYDRAFSYLQRNNYVEAQRAFNEFTKNYPDSPLVANAQYWLGETYFAQSQYDSAAKIFAKSFQDYPKGPKASDSLLKLALTLEKLNKKNDACLTLQELAKRFTAGPASVLRRGADEGRRMGCGQ